MHSQVETGFWVCCDDMLEARFQGRKIMLPCPVRTRPDPFRCRALRADIEGEEVDAGDTPENNEETKPAE